MGFIGVVDSGVGGLTVLRQLRQNRCFGFVYVADHAFCPYGTKSNDVLYARADKIVGYLKENGAQAIVLACNTLSCFAQKLQQTHGIPVRGVVEPTCRQIVEDKAQSVALLATKSTIANGAYQSVLSKSGVRVITFDCSSFVPFVEQRAVTSIGCQRAVHEALRDLPQMQVDAVILGCTHFPLLKRQIAYYCKGKTIVECRCDLTNGILSLAKSKTADYLTTGDVEFANAAASWYESGKAQFRHVAI